MRVWAQALSEVVLTALKERSTMPATRNADSLSVDPRIAARAIIAVVFVAAAVAEEAIRRLGLEMSPDELLDSLTIEQVESSQFIQLGYTGTDPERVQEVVNTVGEVSSERISATSLGSHATI